jgi:hypothetical protein
VVAALHGVVEGKMALDDPSTQGYGPQRHQEVVLMSGITNLGPIIQLHSEEFGRRKLKGEYKNVVWAEFSTLSWAFL